MTMSEVIDPEASRNQLRRAADDAPLRGSREAWRGCLALAGPTASGKSAASLAIAQRWPVEIVSVDSALVYRGMDIGTAKPSRDEQAQVPHHLIDTTDPRDAYSAAEFVRDAQRLIGEINARGRTPLLVGGTMLYFKALMQGLNDMPPADATGARRDRSQGLGPGLAGPARGAGTDRPRHRRPPLAQRRAAHPARARSVRGVWPAAVQLPDRAQRRPCQPHCPRRAAEPRTADRACCCMRASPSASTPCWQPASSTK